MPRRRKGQCLDFAVGGLKKLAYDAEVPAATRLRAIELMLKLDGVHPEEKGAVKPTEIEAADSLLAGLRAKHEVSGGANATA